MVVSSSLANPHFFRVEVSRQLNRSHTYAVSYIGKLSGLLNASTSSEPSSSWAAFIQIGCGAALHNSLYSHGWQIRKNVACEME